MSFTRCVHQSLLAALEGLGFRFMNVYSSFRVSVCFFSRCLQREDSKTIQIQEFFCNQYEASLPSKFGSCINRILAHSNFTTTTRFDFFAISRKYCTLFRMACAKSMKAFSTFMFDFALVSKKGILCSLAICKKKDRFI